ncbi:histidinol-phosphate transaminase [Buchnera aphidicola]|uniref:histidinol-phosphate transaminase n=1 Tax=Buchnera aphidicola TaxID=9 RepID=UPI00094C5D13|nr:histidinol-phosphate transaminase [Buchnera aphidicola]
MKKLIPQHIVDLQPYQSARRLGLSGRIYLNANEAPWNTVANYKNNNLNRYPDFQSKELLKKYSKYSRVSPHKILITRGVDEGIDLLIRAFCVQNCDKVMFFSPTYDMYSISADIYNIEKINIPLLSSFELNKHAIKKNLNNIKIIYICNPNNPTGNLFLKKDMVDILNFIPKTTLLVIDEAYIDYSVNNSLSSKLDQYTNLVILRTLSKAFGLAALRCGFILSNIEIIRILQKVLAPYPIATPVSELAIQHLHSGNIQKIQGNILKILKNKEFLIKQLKTYSYIQRIFPSEANFILIKVFQSKRLFNHIKSHGIIIRDQSHKLGLENCLRISIGTMSECKDLIHVLSIFEGKKNIQ